MGCQNDQHFRPAARNAGSRDLPDTSPLSETIADAGRKQSQDARCDDEMNGFFDNG